MIRFAEDWESECGGQQSGAGRESAFVRRGHYVAVEEAPIRTRMDGHGGGGASCSDVQWSCNRVKAAAATAATAAEDAEEANPWALWSLARPRFAHSLFLTYPLASPHLMAEAKIEQLVSQH